MSPKKMVAMRLDEALLADFDVAAKMQSRSRTSAVERLMRATVDKYRADIDKRKAEERELSILEEL